MARYNILRLNKMSSGQRRGLIDMDIALDFTNDIERLSFIANYPKYNRTNPLAKEANLSTELILNETQENDDEYLEATSEQIKAFKKKMQKLRVIYEFENDADANKKACFNNGNMTVRDLPLNDILDVCIKSMFKKSYANRNIPGNLVHQAAHFESDGNVDIYVVLDDYPICFCNCHNDSFMLTQPTTKTPYLLQSDAAKKIQDKDMSNFDHKFHLEQKDIETYIYKPLVDINRIIDSLSGDITAKSTISCYEPLTSLKGIRYNYVVDVDQNVQSSKDYDNMTIYSNGDIYGCAIPTKNVYNSLYSMQMASRWALDRCRSYCGIESCQNKIYLKYYDDLYYRWPASGNMQVSTYTLVGSSNQRLWPYQKIEFFYPTQMQTKARHKSNLFSVKIRNTNLDESEYASGNRKQLMDIIKKDISNGVKSLVDSIAPANTQLFGTDFI